MFLRSLTLKGFKSFADATTLSLEQGVCVVVGPNGSGKSNVVDAIAWVLGAQAPSAVRSQKMEDVIFAGTAKRPALGRAEVSITIDNSAGILPIEFTEVTISRTLWRSGESEYAINGVSCRLLDLQELLSDAGVGRQQHVIVSQGQIDAVLNARPEERRSIIEEAAGVLKYRKRKEKAERRLEATEGNLLRLQDLLREVRRQLRPLEKQAEAARRHDEVVTELRALRLFLTGRDIAGMRIRLGTVANERRDMASSENELRAELAQLDTDVMATEAELSALGGFDLGDALARSEQLRERGRGIAAVIAERRRGLDRDRLRLADAGPVAAFESEARKVQNELDEVDASSLGLEPAYDELAEAEGRLAADQADFEQTQAEGAQVPRAAGAAAEVRGELRTLRQAAERGTQELIRLERRHQAIVDKLARLTTDIDRLRNECEQAEGHESPLVAELERAEGRRVAAEQATEATEVAWRQAQADRSTWAARAEALAMALDAARARAGAQKLASVQGVVGTLLDLVEVDPGWETAFEAAAGEALAAVVVDGLDAARRSLARLAGSGDTGAVLALGAGLAHLAAPPVGEPVRRHVRPKDRTTDAAVARLLDGLVGGAVVVDGSWEAAFDAVLAHPGAIVVTRSGDRFGASGWRVGSAGAGATGAALEEARNKADATDAELTRRDGAYRTARSELAAARAAETEISRRLDTNDARFTAAADGLARAQAERRDAEIDREAVERQLLELRERVGRDQARLHELDSVLPGLEAEETAEAAAARAITLARIRLQERQQAVAAIRRDLEVRAAGLDQRRQFLQRRHTEVIARLDAAREARADADARLAVVERSLMILDRLGAVVAGHQAVVEAELHELQELRRQQSDRARAVAQRLDTLRKQRQGAEKRLEELRERQRRVELDQAEVTLRLEAAVEACRRELDVEPAVAEASACPPLPEGQNAQGRSRDLDRELRIMGPVNPLALEEFNALKERNEFLETQLEDVKTTRRELVRVIRAIDTEIQNVFASAFTDVSTHFTSLFTALFPGGAGKLILTAPDDLLNTGVEVEAKPSGKNVKKLSLLSGGERSLTALAFLFAVFRSRPSPFYVMDEVEAALDDVNLHRFLGLVQEFRDEAQLIIVSHQKRTMDAADVLYGVTMQPGGSSKVVAEKVGAER